MLENPQVAKDLIYNYRGIKIKATRNEAGWNSVYVAGKIIKKIGPILAINSEDFNQKYVVKKLIKGLPLEQKSIEIKGLSTNSKKIKKRFYFLQLKSNKFNGEKYIDEAIARGAVLIICSKHYKFSNNKIFIIKTPDVRNLLSEICSKFLSQNQEI